MPVRPAPLPSPLPGEAFRTGDARHVPVHRLRAKDLWIPTRGVRLPRYRTERLDVLEAIALTFPPGAAFSHSTAAVLWRLPLPPGLSEAVHVTTPTGTRARRGPMIVGHERFLRSDEVDASTPMPRTTPQRAFCDMAEQVDLTALVAIGDAAARMVGADAVEEAVAQHTRPRRVLKRALDLLDPASESPKESELRVLLHAAGVPHLTANHVLAVDGRFVARIDLALPERRIAIEYEGDHHRDRQQWRQDISRRRRIEALGWIYLSVTQYDLQHPTAMLADIRSAIVAQGGGPSFAATRRFPSG